MASEDLPESLPPLLGFLVFLFPLFASHILLDFCLSHPGALGLLSALTCLFCILIDESSSHYGSSITASPFLVPLQPCAYSR
ncbi:hypothetical protein C8R43DRAFT_450035 [Mycena crocata]|nr:hypothetical protein C8R43DRAFT_450035 [Mycena crocata]